MNLGGLTPLVNPRRLHKRLADVRKLGLPVGRRVQCALITTSHRRWRQSVAPGRKPGDQSFF